MNADLGEDPGSDVDEAMLRIVSSANIACGGHAGDAETMRRTVRLAIANGVRIGAHPSYPDRAHFGRRHLDMTSSDLATSLADQISSLDRIAQNESSRVAYIKPHGALYNDAATGDETAIRALTQIAQMFRLPVMTLPESALARRMDSVIREGFVDRAYREDGTLVPRTEPGALVTDPAEAAGRALELAPGVDSLSVHSDTPGAVELAAAARRVLQDAGYRIASTPK